MIAITGDIHGEFSRFQEYDDKLKEGDTLLVCGDFGFLFLNDAEEQSILDKMEEKPYNICFVDGNHENFPAIFSYPQEEWNGGKIHRIRKNVIHLMRGQIFTIEGVSFFTFGGAYSIDRCYRQKNITYWEEEIPTDAEYQEAAANLEKVGKKVDVILTHTAPREIIVRMGYQPNMHDLELTGFLEWVMSETDFKKWLFGHWHKDMMIDDKFRAIYFETVKVW